MALTRFQSTPPVKAATFFPRGARQSMSISIHAAREGGDNISANSASKTIISIHAAREGGDPMTRPQHSPVSISIHAAREGGDWKAALKTAATRISIHAAREGGDALAFCMCLLYIGNFNPRRP